MLAPLLLSLLLMQASDGRGSSSGGAALAKRIHHLVEVAVITGDDKETDAAVAEARQLFTKRGLASIAEVGDMASYEFAFLLCSTTPVDFRAQVLRKATAGAKRHQIPADAALYCEVKVRQERAKAALPPPTHPALRDQIERLFEADQAVRQKAETDTERMVRTDRERQAEMEAIFAQHGVPTYRMVGPKAAADFATILQHQPTEFRLRVQPKLKANVEAGQASPGSYATLFDRLQSDQGKKQLYGENLICDAANPELHTGPIEDETNVNQRRAAIGLPRLELNIQFIIAVNPNLCPPQPK